MNNFLDIKYLESGNEIQKKLYYTLSNLKIINILLPFCPLVVGTIPIGVNIPDSDVDIICNVEKFAEFEIYIKENFSEEKGFFFKRKKNVCLSGFEYSDFRFEIYGESKPTTEQNAYSIC